MWAAWGALALATLSKGLIGIVLPGAALVAYTLITRDWALWRRLHLISGAIVFFALAAPWFIGVSVRNPEFFNFFFIHEHFTRYLTGEHHREGAWWYFVPLFIPEYTQKQIPVNFQAEADRRALEEGNYFEHKSTFGSQ